MAAHVPRASDFGFWGVQDKKVHGAAKRVRREDEMPMKKPFGPGIDSSSARADTFRPFLGAYHGPIRV